MEDIKIQKVEHLPTPIRDFLRSEGREFLRMGLFGVAHWVIWLPHSEKLGPITSTPVHFPQDKVEDIFINLTTALRLCHEGMVTPGEIWFVSPPPYELGVIAYSFESYISRRYEISAIEPYVLSESDVSMTKGLVEQISKWRKSDAAIDIAIRRFNLSYSGELEDRLIDQMIAFESLYIGDDKELGYKLALRTTILLEKDKDKRRAIFSDMKTAYDLRGKVVHGTKQAELSKLEEIIPKTEEYLRQSIRKFLALSLTRYSLEKLKKGKNKRLANLDENILSNGILLAPNRPSEE